VQLFNTRAEREYFVMFLRRLNLSGLVCVCAVIVVDLFLIIQAWYMRCVCVSASIVVDLFLKVLKCCRVLQGVAGCCSVLHSVVWVFVCINVDWCLCKLVECCLQWGKQPYSGPAPL